MIRRLVGPALILCCTVIWGGAFLAQKQGGEHLGPFAINCYRNVLGGVFLAIVLAVRGGIGAVLPTQTELIGGFLSGCVLFCAMMAQQVGLESTTPGISAFLTANYVLLVPVFAWLLGKGRPAFGVWIGVALALAGSFLICMGGISDFKSIGAGELWTLLCAALFALQIMAVDRFASKGDVIRFSMVQLLAAALVAFPFVFLPSELARASWSRFNEGLPALLFLGVLSSGIAYTLQNLGQARTPAALAAIIMSMESVFGALFGWLFRNDAMTARQMAGCVFVFLAVVLSQIIPSRR